jgi:hypothetical protein
MTGIDDLFREYSEPDEFVSQYQLESFGWYLRRAARERDERRRWKPARRAKLIEYRRRWRAANRAQQAAYRAANRDKRNAYFRERRALLRAA